MNLKGSAAPENRQFHLDANLAKMIYSKDLDAYVTEKRGKAVLIIEPKEKTKKSKK